MGTSAELLAVNYDHAVANRDAFLKSIFDETILGYCRNIDPPRNSYEEITSITDFYNELKNGEGKLRGLQYLKKLTTIALSLNNYTDIGKLNGLVNLVTLELYANKLTDIGSLTNLKKLVTIRVHSNKLTNIGNLIGLKALVTLEAYSNLLTNIGSLANCSNLATLNLKYNQFESFTATYIPWNNLVTLSFEGNKIPTSGTGGIDAILAAANAGRSTYGKLASINLSGEYMGIPTGGNANTDVVALRSAGVTVTIRTS